MCSYLVRFIDEQVKNCRDSDSVNKILNYLTREIIPITGNYFDELVEIAIVAKPYYALCYDYVPFVVKLKEKILEQRGEIDSEALIKKFT